MNLHDLRPAPGSTAVAKRKGRGTGSGNGKTAGRGHKGQWARSGGGVRPGFEGGQMPITRRLPKRGFNNTRFAKVYGELNVCELNAFAEGSVVDYAALYERDLVKKNLDGVRILGNGELTVKNLTVRAAGITASAKEKIEAMGGKAEVI